MMSFESEETYPAITEPLGSIVTDHLKPAAAAVVNGSAYGLLVLGAFSLLIGLFIGLRSLLWIAGVAL